MSNKLLVGYDNNGTVFDAGDIILRKIKPEYFNELKEIFGFYKSLELNKYGIVLSELNIEEKTLHHKKHVISYPYEWTANMFKDAVLFHLKLFLTLDENELTLKDGLPSNVLFNSTSPVFVDFLSLIKTDKLYREKWLVKGTVCSDFRYAVFDKMFTPFFLIPFLATAQNKYKLARTLLLKKACNIGMSSPDWKDLTVNEDVENARKILNRKNDMKFELFCTELINLITNIDVTPKKSAYSSYYDDKKENFSFENQESWKAKQTGVFSAIKKYNPETVLDIGANAGWFSMLAEKNSAKVISVEIDEASVDNLYLHAKECDLNILPLQISFENLKEEHFGINYEGSKYPEYKGRDFKNTPLFLAPTDRLKCDMTMCLALAHHLVLGAGTDINEVMQILSNLTNDVLVLEFIGLDDNLIKTEPSFFANLCKYTEENYNIDKFIEAGKQYFESVEILNSHPETRKLLVFKK